MKTNLLADVGGTRVRFATTEPGGLPRTARILETADFPDFTAALRAYVADALGDADIDAIAVGAAGPVVGDRVVLTNLGWELGREALRDAAGARRCILVNDFNALAWSLPALTRDDVRTLSNGVSSAGSACALIGPGTGLGISGLIPDGLGGFAAIEGEGGHRTLAPASAREWAVIEQLAGRFGHVSAERVVSGPGLLNIHEALSTIDGSAPVPFAAPEDLARAAFEHGDPAARESVELFTAWLGSVAGDHALTLGARGGLYIGGGIVPAWGKRFDFAAFHERFLAKGRYRDYLEAIPVRLITHSCPALIGLAHLVEREAARER